MTSSVEAASNNDRMRLKRAVHAIMTTVIFVVGPVILVLGVLALLIVPSVNGIVLAVSGAVATWPAARQTLEWWRHRERAALNREIERWIRARPNGAHEFVDDILLRISNTRQHREVMRFDTEHGVTPPQIDAEVGVAAFTRFIVVRSGVVVRRVEAERFRLDEETDEATHVPTDEREMSRAQRRKAISWLRRTQAHIPPVAELRQLVDELHRAQPEPADEE